MVLARRSLTVMLALTLLLAGFAGSHPATAQRAPGPVELEALIKSTLLTFNDANVTGNYTVFHARLAQPFRDEFSPDRLKEAFRSFSQQDIDFSIIAALKPKLTEEPRIDERGALLLRGHFEASPNRVTFELDYIQPDGEWRLINIHVKVQPPE